MTSWRNTTESILTEVEHLSGKSIEMVEDPDLPVTAALNLARDGAPFHLLRYSPKSQPLDYAVAYQSGFVLRLFANPPEMHFDFSPNDSGRSAMRSLITAGVPPAGVDAKAVDGFVAVVYQWALMTLRSLPIGMRIDHWLHEQHPEFRDQVVDGIAQQQRLNINALSERLGSLTVPTHLLGMNAAYALFTDRMLGCARYAVPYAAVGALPYGRRLLDLCDRIPADPAHDCELVDAWAAELGLAGYYQWIPYRP